MSEQDRHSMVIRADARAMSAVTALDVRVSERWKATANRAVGTAFDDEGNPVLTEQGHATVKVTRDGQTFFVPASSFRRPRDTRATRSKNPGVQKKRMMTNEVILRGMDWDQ